MLLLIAIALLFVGVLAALVLGAFAKTGRDIDDEK